MTSKNSSEHSAGRPRRRRRGGRPRSHSSASQERAASGNSSGGSRGGKGKPGRLERALDLVTEEARERLQRHPWRSFVDSLQDQILLEVRVELARVLRGGAASSEAKEQLSEALDQGIESALLHHAVVKPGRVLCHRCPEPECEHSQPPEQRSVMVSYGPTGAPRYLDFGQFLLERRHPDVNRLYEERGLVVLELAEDDLYGDMLAEFASDQLRVVGQVCAGWLGWRSRSSEREHLALTCQFVRVGGTQTPRFALNVLGRAPAGATLEEVLQTRECRDYWQAIAWARRALGDVERGGRGARGAQGTQQRIDGIRGGLARRLERHERATRRRTRHAEDRRRDLRPTAQSFADLSAVADSDVLWDTRRRTLVVPGSKGRVHIFNDQGKLVTSIRVAPQGVESRVRRGIWKPAQSGTVARLRAAVAKTVEGDESDGDSQSGAETPDLETVIAQGATP